MRDVVVNWDRSSRTFIVKRRNGPVIARDVEDIVEAWKIAAGEQRAMNGMRVVALEDRREASIKARIARTGRKAGRLMAGSWT